MSGSTVDAHIVFRQYEYRWIDLQITSGISQYLHLHSRLQIYPYTHKYGDNYLSGYLAVYGLAKVRSDIGWYLFRK